ncbi:single-stranded-DNA-specific exonuclease RecJ [Candidatus Viadribacter manganicus]|uniref:Single-stranded-DNA-specific exonuclease RecJ n=1 Tax=Candidatus Viadribacter manganicus TaxID=1759059 RepID=A0A1B1ADG2_9PROT|nr:single-stranded-DNA-specific exonuclease RecJ [Candidatus Viadribacter manganicus]ANP44597.1 single-stranded-DNA-specific exonuclease RecJ [Candidatus Viadribacter manganicus]
MSAARKLETGGAFLGVERSLTGRRWRTREADLGLVEAFRRQFSLPEIAARLMAARGIGLEDAEAFLFPTLKTHFPDPSSFADMDEAARVIEDAIVAGRSCAVFADYDVDGGSSGAQLVRYFRARGRDLKIYVPDRMKEGYGPSALAFERLKAEGVDLVITVDCGAAAEGPLNAAAQIGLEVVVLDHHLMGGPPPKARAVVNPNRLDDTSGQGALTAAGVVLVTLAAVNREARRRGSPGSNHLPDIIQMLDLAAIGTVCDVAPLTGFNRAIVSQGLKILRNGKNIGMVALAESAGRKGSATVYDFGFILGPRINAGGRVGDASLATRLLSTEDPEEARELAATLEALNAERRQREAEMLAEAETAAIAEAEHRSVIIVGSHRWHPGVIGIAAGRLKDRLHKPTIVLGGVSEHEPAKGSGRSTPGVNLGAAVAAAKEAGLLINGGGHAAAAGLTVEWDKVEALKEFLSERLAGELAAAAGEARALTVDAMSGVGAVDVALIDALEQIGPYGQGHPEPVLALTDVRVSFAKLVKDEHVRFTLEDARGARVSGIAFRAMKSPLGEALMKKDVIYHAAVRVKRNEWNGNVRAEVEIVDLAEA